MKKTIQIGIAFMITFLVISGCKKDSATTETSTQKLTGKNWRMVSITASPGFSNGAGGFITDLFAFQDACSKDDFMLFSANGTYVSDEGAVKCDPTSPQTTPGTWAFANNETQLVIDGDVSDIMNLDKTNLRIKTVGEIDSTMQTIIVTFNH